MHADPANPDAAGPDERIAMTDLSEALMGPDGAAVRQDIVDRLERLLSKVQSQLQHGVRVGALEPTQDVYKALATARGLMIQATS